ncbi:UDP-glycosyltransferase 79B30-like [Abrus precatorius]|uniref:UDP-glycosyltransferase 79B30-like n=1 Tax=Abrus precatorius TaxID=3816 RepID=A0A8B8KW94_ABRPR|nr:UDP-glycosyltransferase 79B30-like [Abrus precatorius]
MNNFLSQVTITLFPITIPQVDGLPSNAETTADVPFSLITHLMTAMDRTEKDIELLLLHLKPNVVLFDFTCWMPSLTRRLGIKSVQYTVISMIAAAYVESVEKLCQEKNLDADEWVHPPVGFPDSSIKLQAHEVRLLASFMKVELGSGVPLHDRISTGTKFSDAVGFKGCRELEGQYAEYLETLFGKPFLLSGLVLPELNSSTLDEKWAEWLAGFKPGSVIYCAFGSEWRMHHDQFKELLLGLELTGFPFLAALKEPIGFESVEAALPEGFKERVQGRGIVHGGWIQETLILEHPSIGCFITHCGSGSLLAALLNKCQIVVLPNLLDQILNARMISSTLKAGVEVEKGEEDGLFTKESVCKAVKTVMDDESEVGREVRANRLKLRKLLLNKDLENTYIDSFVQKLQELVG